MWTSHIAAGSLGRHLVPQKGSGLNVKDPSDLWPVSLPAGQHFDGELTWQYIKWHLQNFKYVRFA